MIGAENLRCPLCHSEVATYVVTHLGGGGGDADRHVGCGAEEGKCLLAKKSWSLAQWDALCGLLLAVGEYYPGATHDRLTLNSRLRDLANRWYGHACIIGACMGEDHAAAKAFLRCRKDLCEATGETGL